MCFATNQNQICKITPVEVIVATDVVAFVVVVELVVVVDFDVDVEYIVNSPRYSLTNSRAAVKCSTSHWGSTPFSKILL